MVDPKNNYFFLVCLKLRKRFFFGWLSKRFSKKKVNFGIGVDFKGGKNVLFCMEKWKGCNTGQKLTNIFTFRQKKKKKKNVIYLEKTCPTKPTCGQNFFPCFFEREGRVNFWSTSGSTQKNILRNFVN